MVKTTTEKNEFIGSKEKKDVENFPALVIGELEKEEKDKNKTAII